MKQTAERYTSLKPVFSGFFESDHVSFASEGFVCIGVREEHFNLARHTRYDVIGNLNFQYLADVTRMVLATVLVLGGAGE